MEVRQGPWQQLQEEKPCAVALGYFDGVHLGHQQVIDAAGQLAAQNGLRSAVFTFTVAQGQGKSGPLLMDEECKHRALAALGVAVCYEPSFDSFSGLTPIEFVRDMLVGHFGAKAVCCGENFRFGAKRAGDVALLEQLCGQFGLALRVVPLAGWQGGVVSSSRIRAALAEGQITEANAMLGRPFEISLPVQKGRSLGSKLGFPTINQVFPPALQPPAFGVYVTQTELNDKFYPSATGYGTRPTVNGSGATCETFIPGFEGDLYGKRVRLRFYDRIADIRRFSSVLELAAAVQHWADEATAYFA